MTGSDTTTKLEVRHLSLVLLSVFLAAGSAWGRPGLNRGEEDSGARDPWRLTQLIEPEVLLKALSRPPDRKPAIFYVGPVVLYRSVHIPDAKLIGPTMQAAALGQLMKELERIPRDREVVLYCGCCPWEDCPNIRPAFSAAQKMGFTKLRVLHLPQNFKQDWIDRGFPIQRVE